MPPLHVRALFVPLLALSLALAGGCLGAVAARAQLAPAGVIDGPSPTILDVDGAAMAPDGSGGILYRKLLDGQAHLFVARFTGGAWQSPVQVDSGQPFSATFPAIAAGDGGRLLVVWEEPWAVLNQATQYELMSAEISPGATQFGPAIQIDPKGIGDGTAAYPSLAMAPNGQAYVAYRVVTDNLLANQTIVPTRPGDELIDVRVARYNGQGLYWTSLGRINDHPQLTMRHPTAENGPQIGVSLGGNAVVTWQEPDASGYARILARRVFGSRLGTAVLDVSATSANGQPIDTEADAPAIAVSTFGEAKIAYRLAGGPGSPYGGPRILLNTLPAETDPKGAKLQGAQVLAAGATLGPPSLAIGAKGELRAAYASGNVAQLVSGSDYEPFSAPLSGGFLGSPQEPASATTTRVLSSINPAGGGVSVWPAADGAGLPAIEAREDYPGGAFQTALLAAPLSGPVGPPALGGSGNGDALIAFVQGPAEAQQVMAAVAKAPPGQFEATTPVGWVRGSAATVTWEAPSEAFGATTYSVLVDGRVRASGLRGLPARLNPRALGDGVHQVQVLATDSLGQQTMTPAATLKVDANPPAVTIRRVGPRSVVVRVVDRASGAVANATRISFGDGARARHRLTARHTYAAAGTYTITVRSHSRAGNILDVNLRVTGMIGRRPQPALKCPPPPRIGRLLLLALAALLLCCASAQATFTPFSLASSSPEKDLEADFAYDPAISADGRYVAFVGSVASQQGVYRKDLSTGRLELVAAGTTAGAPSISANGQYVSFTSSQNPETGAPEDEAGCSSVYVRNMQFEPAHEVPQAIPTKVELWQPPEPQPGEPPETFEDTAFTLVSAGNGTPASLTYAPEAARACGSASAARVAISASGQQVAFTVLSPSSLTGACEHNEETDTLECPTPPYQIAVRDLRRETTTLVSSTLASQEGGGTPQPVPGGAALAAPTYTNTISLKGGGHAQFALGGSTAAISADGSTVAWMGIEIAAQAPVTNPLPKISPSPGLYYPDSYAEPLWRRIDEGPATATRRVLAGDDPSAPECPPACAGGVDLGWDTQSVAGNEYTGDAPQYGSYISQARSATGFASSTGLSDPLDAVTPQLSEDGMTVALLSTQPNWGEDPNFGLFDQTLAPPANAFVVNMAPGLTRAQAITRLTDWASLNFNDRELASPVTSIAISGDGTRVLFSTERVAFPLAPPALITPTLSQAAVAQLYEANLRGGTLALVSFGYDGQPANEEVFAASLSEDGHTIALAAGATNLVYGVVNQGSDIYTTEEVHSPAAPGQQSVSPAPQWPGAEVPWNLSATAARSPDGTLELWVSVPGAGRLSASALSSTGGPGTSSPRSRKASKTAGRGRARRAATARKGRGPKRGSKARKPVAPTGTTIARAAMNTTAPGVIEMHLIPAARYDSLLQSSRYGLYSTITLTFTAPGHKTVRATLRASFPRRPPIYPLPKPRHDRSKRK